MVPRDKVVKRQESRAVSRKLFEVEKASIFEGLPALPQSDPPIVHQSRAMLNNAAAIQSSEPNALDSILVCYFGDGRYEHVQKERLVPFRPRTDPYRRYASELGSVCF